jgi:hypothetical protein
MSLNQEVDECGTGRRAPVHVDADADRWDGFEDWKLFDGLAWKTLEKVVDSMFNEDRAGHLKIVRDVYRLSFRLMKMQSHFPLKETALNSIRSELYFKAEDLCESDDHGLSLDHDLEISEEEVEKADCEVNYDRISLVADLSTSQQICLCEGESCEGHWRFLWQSISALDEAQLGRGFCLV